MNTAEQILVITLAATLAILLVLAIIAMVQVIRLVKTLRSIASKAEGFVNSAEAMGDFARQTVGKLNVLHFLHSIIDVVRHKQDGKK